MRNQYLVSHSFCSIIYTKEWIIMEITIKLDGRQYYDISTYCNANNLDITEYITEILKERHSINKYGDLNEIMPKVIEQSTVSVKKRGRPKKETANEDDNIIVDEKKDNGDDEIIKPTVKRKRTLKTL